MKIVYLPSTLDDLEWSHRYYTHVFPEGAENAVHQLETIKNLLLSNPLIGTTVEGSVKEFSIPNTPFSYIYRVRGDELQVLRVWDERRNPTDMTF